MCCRYTAPWFGPDFRRERRFCLLHLSSYSQVFPLPCGNPTPGKSPSSPIVDFSLQTWRFFPAMGGLPKGNYFRSSSVSSVARGALHLHIFTGSPQGLSGVRRDRDLLVDVDVGLSQFHGDVMNQLDSADWRLEQDDRGFLKGPKSSKSNYISCISIETY